AEVAQVVEARRRHDPDQRLGASLTLLGHTLEFQGEVAAAEPVYREALALAIAASGPEDPAAALAMNGLAGALRYLGRNDEAEVLLRRAVDIWDRQFGLEHPFTSAGLHHL